MKLETKLRRLIKDAEANWEEHKKLVARTEDLINGTGIWEELKEVDRKFGMKVNHYPGDITTHRIAKTLTKFLEQYDLD